MMIDNDARRHREIVSASVIARVLDALDQALGRGVFLRDDVERRFPFLDRVGDELAELAGGKRNARDPELFVSMSDDIAERADEVPPLACLHAAAGDRAAAEMLAAAALVEHDVRFGDVFALLQQPTSSARPSLGLLAMLLRRDQADLIILAEALAADGFIELQDSDGLRGNQTIRLPTPVLRALDGVLPDGTDLRLPGGDPEHGGDRLVTDPARRAHIDRIAALVDDGSVDTIIAEGPSGSGRSTALGAVADRLVVNLLVAHRGDPDAGVIAVLTRSMLAWRSRVGIGETIELARPRLVPVVAAITGRHGTVRVAHSRQVAVIDMPRPGVDARRRLWSRTALEATPPTLDELSRSFLFTGGTIVDVAERAAAISRVDGRSLAEVDDVRRAARHRGRQQLEGLAHLLAPLPDGLHPILDDATADALDVLELRVRHREQLGASIGGPATTEVTTGVKALMSGASGTGKTLAARFLGARVGLDVHRADLAALVDKYIGETEKRIDELFTRAEGLDIVLLIDEGDALLTQRTDVRSSNDRYANLQTDYVLQRLEAYEGIVVITTNSPQLIDSAFRRRLDVTIAFGPPGPAERLGIWKLHLPRQHRVRRSTLAEVAERCRLTGGQIRNASVHAGLIALDRDRLVDDRMLAEAVEREFRLAGKTSPLRPRNVDLTAFERAVAGS